MGKRYTTSPHWLPGRLIMYQDEEKWPHMGEIVQAADMPLLDKTGISVRGENDELLLFTLPYRLPVLTSGPDANITIDLKTGAGHIVVIYSAERSNV